MLGLAQETHCKFVSVTAPRIEAALAVARRLCTHAGRNADDLYEALALRALRDNPRGLDARLGHPKAVRG